MHNVELETLGVISHILLLILVIEDLTLAGANGKVLLPRPSTAGFCDQSLKPRYVT